MTSQTSSVFNWPSHFGIVGDLPTAAPPPVITLTTGCSAYRGRSVESYLQKSQINVWAMPRKYANTRVVKNTIDLITWRDAFNIFPPSLGETLRPHR